jgi:hypothetical protein
VPRRGSRWSTYWRSWKGWNTREATSAGYLHQCLLVPAVSRQPCRRRMHRGWDIVGPVREGGWMHVVGLMWATRRACEVKVDCCSTVVDHESLVLGCESQIGRWQGGGRQVNAAATRLLKRSNLAVTDRSTQERYKAGMALPCSNSASRQSSAGTARPSEQKDGGC